MFLYTQCLYAGLYADIHYLTLFLSLSTLANMAHLPLQQQLDSDNRNHTVTVW